MIGQVCRNSVRPDSGSTMRSVWIPVLRVLEARRDHLRAELGSVGDLRPGTLVERYRKCGKPSCHCAREGDPGHGPVWTLVFSAQGKSKTRVIPPEAVAATRAQIEECRRLRRLTGELIEVSEGSTGCSTCP